MLSRPVVAALALLLAAALGCSRAEPEPIAPTPAAETAAEAPAAPAAAPSAPSTTTASADAATATVGRPAPDFTLTDQAGVEHRLAAYRGKIVVLEWTNPECPYVQRHYEDGTMTGLAGRLPSDAVVWLAVDSSHFVTPASAESWRAKNGIAYPILLDPSGTVGRAYAARTTPHMFVVDAEGVLRYSGAIDDDVHGRNAEDTNHVEAAVNALRAGEAPPRAQTDPYGCSVKYQS